MKTQIEIKKLKLISETMGAWGDTCKYKVDPDDMPATGEAYVMQRLNYSSQPMNIKSASECTETLSA